MNEEWNYEMSYKWIHQNPYVSTFHYKAHKAKPQLGQEFMQLYHDCIQRNVTYEIMRTNNAKSEMLANDCAIDAWEIISTKMKELKSKSH